MGDHEVNDLKIIRQVVHREVLNLRALYRLMESDEFVDAFQNAKDKTSLQTILGKKDVEGLKAWIKENLPAEFENMSYRQLRRLCKNNHIYRWSRLSHEEMVEALREASIRPSKQSARSGTPISD